MADEMTTRTALDAAGEPVGGLDTLTIQHREQLLRAARIFEEHVRNPVTASIQAALLRPTDEVLNNQRARVAYYTGQPLDFTADNGRRALAVPALGAIGDAIVAHAIAGAPSALAMIADRLEGKVGMRAGEISEATAQTRGAVREAIESAVRLLNVTPTPGDDAKPVDVGTVTDVPRDDAPTK